MTFIQLLIIVLFAVGIVTIIVFLSIKPITIEENKVGIVIKTLSLPFQPSLPNHQRIALKGEAGVQADTLPPGKYWRYWPWMYKVHKVKLINISPGDIGLVYAKDGAPIPPERLLGRVVDCHNFQDTRAFLMNGGQKGQQLSILTAGEYRINTEMFDVITSSNLDKHNINLSAENLRVYRVDSDQIGIVTTYDGVSLPAGEIAAPTILGHNSFQNVQNFIDAGGHKGLQEEILSAGAYNLNPWFVKVKLVRLTDIQTGTVGVVISHVGKTVQEQDRNQLVEHGYKGICKTPLSPGRHAINTEVMDIVIVPTNPITLEWNNDPKPPTNYDAKLHALKLRSKDEFLFEIEVTQIIRIEPKHAPQMILSIGAPLDNSTTEPISRDDSSSTSRKYPSIRDLVIKVLEPTIGSYFRASAQHYHAMDFHSKRDKRQIDSQEIINTALSDHGVLGVDTLINEIALPDELERILQERKFSEEQRKNYENELLTEKARQGINLVKAQAEVRLAQLKAQAKKEETGAEADAIRQKGEAEAKVIEQKGEAEAKSIEALIKRLTLEGYFEITKIEQLGQIKLPDIMSGQNSLIEALFSPLIRSYVGQQLPDKKTDTSHPLLEEISKHLNENPGLFDANLIIKTVENLMQSAHFSNIAQISPTRAHKLPFNSDTKNTTEVDVVDTTVVIEKKEEKE